jgi:hypothetical protein
MLELRLLSRTAAGALSLVMVLPVWMDWFAHGKVVVLALILVLLVALAIVVG